MLAVIAGSQGLIGGALVESLTNDGHEVIRLVRRDPATSGESPWDPRAGSVDLGLIRSADVVINLAGAPIGDKRLTRRYATTVLESRVSTTSLLARSLADRGGGHLIQASAMGFYGSRGAEPFDEEAQAGTGLLANIVTQWEAAASPAVAAGVTVAWLRTGLVLAPTGGLAARLLPLIRLGLLRRLGPAHTWMSWIALDDAVRAIRFLADGSHAGPVNVIAPNPARSPDLIGALARASGRPALFPVPGFALRAAIGPAADDLLASQRGVPGVLDRIGFTWNHPDVDSAARWVVDKRRIKE